jgi:hypothetical protein
MSVWIVFQVISHAIVSGGIFWQCVPSIGPGDDHIDKDFFPLGVGTTEKQKDRGRTVIGVLPNLAEGDGQQGDVICTSKGIPYRLPYQGLLSCELR